MTKFTDAPWALAREQDKVFVVSAVNNQNVAEISLRNDRGLLNPETRANSRLIMMAPEMFKAMKEFHSWFAGYVGDDVYSELLRSSTASPLREFLRVIGTVRGQTEI